MTSSLPLWYELDPVNYEDRVALIAAGELDK